jgi:hypothetical protein
MCGAPINRGKNPGHNIADKLDVLCKDRVEPDGGRGVRSAVKRGLPFK